LPKAYSVFNFHRNKPPLFFSIKGILASNLTAMKEEILTKLENLLKEEDVQNVKKEFKELSAQYKTFMHDVGDDENTAKQDEDIKDKEEESKSEGDVSEKAVEESAENEIEKAAESEEEPKETEEEVRSEDQSDVKDTANSKPDDGKAKDELDEKFQEISKKFKDRVDQVKEDKDKLEKETVAKAKALIEDLKQIVENEENIGKSFAGFNSIMDTWKNLPKVSNDAYRDLNVEYNKYVEQFFYNINIYKELKELDLKHNLEEKQRVLEDQKKLLDVNDIRLLEVEVRLNQDRWNEIGPTFKEEWDKIKDEFWTITRAIYKRIQDFYNRRRDEQQKNLEKKKELLERANYLASLNLKAHKKWKEKTNEIIELQKQWKMIGYVPKEDASKIWKEFRTVCDSFFDQKRKHYEELHAEQDANRDKKLKLVEEAEALKDSEEWKETASTLAKLQKDWKKIGAAHQRDENKLWRRFRDACDHFFEAKKGQRSEEIEEQKQNQEQKEKVIEELKAFEPGEDRKVNLDTLKAFSDRWRKIGHVPFKSKDAINKAYRNELDNKYGALKIGKKQKEEIRFEQKLADIKEGAHDDRSVRKEQDAIRGKISKLKSEVTQLENNMGFFASSSQAEKLKQEVEKKVDKAYEEIEVLKERLKLLRDAKE